MSASVHHKKRFESLTAQKLRSSCTAIVKKSSKIFVKFPISNFMMILLLVLKLFSACRQTGRHFNRKATRKKTRLKRPRVDQITANDERESV